jgi:hypothetical protein
MQHQALSTQSEGRGTQDQGVLPGFECKMYNIKHDNHCYLGDIGNAADPDIPVQRLVLPPGQ